jgi:hypothetical protein
MNTTVTIQEATVTALDALTNPATDVIVEAWAMPNPTTEPCSHDALHGKGCCYGPTGDPLCLSCMILWIQANTVAGSFVSIDVTA